MAARSARAGQVTRPATRSIVVEKSEATPAVLLICASANPQRLVICVTSDCYVAE